MMDGKNCICGLIVGLLLMQNSWSVRSHPVGTNGRSLPGAFDVDEDAHPAHTHSHHSDFDFRTLPSRLLVTTATLLSLITVLALCTCGSKPQKNSQPEDEDVNGVIDTPNDDVHIVPLSPTPDEVTVPVPEGSPTNTQNGKPKARTASIQSQNSNSAPADDALVRSATIDRRLPELPPTPMPPVTPTNEEEEDDYNRTYDVIGETKGANNRGTKKEEDNQPKEDDVFDIEDEQYACVTDNAASKKGLPAKPNPPEVNEHVVEIQDVTEEEGDEAYASVVVGEGPETANASYACVGNKDDKNGYARLRSLQKQPLVDSSPEGNEKNGYARLRDVTLESRVVGVANDDEEAPPVPYKPPDLQNDEDFDEDVGTIERTSSTGQSGALGAGASPSLMPESINPAPIKKREPPYTQVSARESLDVVRARQQAEQNARIATHYQSIEEDQTLDADHDGIYEPVDDQHVDKQPMIAPPPLPHDRQGPSNEPSASNDWQMTRPPRLYEEITDETRPKPPGSTAQAAPDQAMDDDDIQPYAVTEKRPIPSDAPAFNLGNNISEANYAKVNKVNKVAKGSSSSQSNNNARINVKAPNNGPILSDDELPLYAVVDKKAKSQGSKVAWDSVMPEVPTSNPMPQEDSYQSIEDMPRNSDSNTAAIAGGMVHVSKLPASSNMWQKKEHMYIDVEKKQSSKPIENAHNTAAGSHSYEIVSVVPPPASGKKDKHKAAKKPKKESKKEKKTSKGGQHKGSSGGKGETVKDPGSSSSDTVWRQQDAMEGNGNANNNTDEYEDIVFPLQETRL